MITDIQARILADAAAALEPPHSPRQAQPAHTIGEALDLGEWWGFDWGVGDYPFTDTPPIRVAKDTGEVTFEASDEFLSASAALAADGGQAHTAHMTDTVVAAPAPPDTLPTHYPFHGVLAPEGLRTGDGRSFADGSLTWADLPLPFRVQPADAPGHDGAIRVGRIDNIWRDDSGDVTKVRFAGAWAEDENGLLTEAAASARNEVRNGSLRTVSVDLDTVTAEFVDSETGLPATEETGEDDFFDFLFGDPGLLVVTAGRIRSATACSIGAFQEAYVADGEWVEGREPGDGQAVPIVPAEASGDTAEYAGIMPDGETECSCDEADPDFDPDCQCEDAVTSAEVETLAIGTDEFVSDEPWGNFSEGDYTPQQWKDACLIHLDAAQGQDPLTKSLHKVPVYEPNGALNRNGCHAAASALAGGRGGVNAPTEAKQAAARTLINLYTRELDETPPDSLYRVAGLPVPENAASSPSSHEAAAGSGSLEPGESEPAPLAWLSAGAAPVYPYALFRDPKFTEDDGRMVQATDGTWGCPLTITDDGHVYGHLAKWGVCHIGFDGVCVTPPPSNADYAYFTTGSLMTDAGEIAVGQITVGTGHAAATLGARPAVAHYDDTGTAAADVVMGEDLYGIWFSGRLRDGLPDDMVESMRLAGAVSGDWRRIGTNLELVAALAVNVPGFPMPRRRLAASGGHQTSLVASCVVSPERVATAVTAGDVTREVFAALRRAERVARLTRRIGRDRASRVTAAIRMIETEEEG